MRSGIRDIAQLAVLQMLRAYKWAVSPLFPPACRYVPTCSEYAMEAVERYGAFRGGFMAMIRLLRCHPFARGGYDPVIRCGDTPGLKPSENFDALCGAQAPPFHGLMSNRLTPHIDCSAQHLERNV